MWAHGGVYSVCVCSGWVYGRVWAECSLGYTKQAGRLWGHQKEDLCSGGVGRKGKMERPAGWVAQWKRNKKKDLKDCGQSRSGEGSDGCERARTVRESELVEGPSLLP